MDATAAQFRVAGYDIDILVQGFPGKSVCHGGLGWSTIALLRSDTRTVLFDTGSFSQRTLVIQGLARRGLKPADVTDVILSHSHWDHSINWVLFPQARVHIGAHELGWAIKEPWGEGPVPELYVRELDHSPRLRRLEDRAEPVPGITAYMAPGHTPGHLIYVVRGPDRDLIFTGDAAKNRVELLTRRADMTYDAAVSRASIEQVWSLWRARDGNIVLPGHDMPMVLEAGAPRYLSEREAAISAWFDDDLETTTLFRLTRPGR